MDTIAINSNIYTESRRKLFVIRGISNSLEIEMMFRKKGKRWTLVKFNA